MRSRKREELHKERLHRFETMVYSQHEKLDRLESLVYRVMHRDRVGYDQQSESYKEGIVSDEGNDTDQESHAPDVTQKPGVTARSYPVTSI
jgi:hypothetical protein